MAVPEILVLLVQVRVLVVQLNLTIMGLKLTKIEHLERYLGGKSHSRKWLKYERNRKIRRTEITKIPCTKCYKDWEY